SSLSLHDAIPIYGDHDVLVICQVVQLLFACDRDVVCDSLSQQNVIGESVGDPSAALNPNGCGQYGPDSSQASNQKLFAGIPAGNLASQGFILQPHRLAFHPATR